MYASETIQNCKNPTGHIDTLRFCGECEQMTANFHSLSQLERRSY